MKKSLPLLPVSQKAYTSFIERIFRIFTVESQRTSMLIALDRYLMGDKSYAGDLAPECAMAFEMLRFDIDLAIARSASARLRARQRKENTACGNLPSTHDRRISAKVDSSEPVSPEEKEGEGESLPFIRPKSRRQRRAETRLSKPKKKWSGLGKKRG